ncbi:Gfo/Idh/MocA family oxidoreductase [Chitinophaga polysaccharea]|uniref:Gfo/Idh/MocA family protein n=1 Tax=Chitinophaga polysaccharea TaxID=1293035 RepID=UPI001454FA00|nr:Gfo/Idh/MocA family oxidoreductase [Chitinophaga polysaccharea]NLR57386.1 Gfo/Idh/MocA family oxidoreductase [Chitinophaga polysaccharea]
MITDFNRRKFIRNAAIAGVGAGLLGSWYSLYGRTPTDPVIRIGIIGLDTTHAIAFTKAFNSSRPVPGLEGMKVAVAFPQTSPDIALNQKRLPGFIEDVKKMGVEIVDSIAALLEKADVVLLESNDGRPHLTQALPVLQAGKKIFIDKPLAASLADGMAIFTAAEKYHAPVFSASSLRFMESAQKVAKEGAIGKVLGADTYSPAAIEKTHLDLYWYGIHGIETLYTVMGTGCKTVTRFHTGDTDVVVGVWGDDRIGTFRGTRSGPDDFGGRVFGEKGSMLLGPFKGYDLLLQQIATFFRTGVSPVKPEETLEILAFMEAAEESKRRNGAPVQLEEIYRKAKRDKK